MFLDMYTCTCMVVPTCTINTCHYFIFKSQTFSKSSISNFRYFSPIVLFCTVQVTVDCHGFGSLFFIIQYLPVFELWKMWGYGLVHVHICFHECVLILFFLLNPLIPHDFGMKQKNKTKILKRMHKTLFYSLFIHCMRFFSALTLSH